MLLYLYLFQPRAIYVQGRKYFLTPIPRQNQLNLRQSPDMCGGS